jgi:mRNA interferase MazF
LKRGAIVVARAPGDFTSKPRPFLVVQSDEVLAVAGVIALCPITSSLSGDALIRIPLAADAANGLRVPSEIAVDLIQAVRRSRVGTVIGHASPAVMRQVDQALRRWLGL